MKHVRQRDDRRGVVTVEMAIVAPLLIFLLFAIIEFGVLIRDVISIHEAAREGTRAAAVGATTTTTLARANSALSPLDATEAQIALEYRKWSFSTGSWGSWQTLTNSGPVNSATPGDQIRVTVTYPHAIMLTGLFGGWSDDGESGIKTLRAATIMRRE
ncbi:MAG: TadE/TadG family type IV pilus assembly protein [Armatimonadota bacterium]|jgi:Flp pilus assembly protein TadG